MRRFQPFRVVVAGVVFAGVLAAAAPARAVILYGSATRNTAPPGSLNTTGGPGSPGGDTNPRRLLDSGWQWQGRYASFLGTAIAPQYFISANHFGVDTTNPFIYNGISYSIDTSFNNNMGFIEDPNSDLIILKVNGTFPTFAPLYNAAVDGPEVGKPFIVFGRGWARGGEVRKNGELKGWYFGAEDGVVSWGENVFDRIANGGAEFGQLLAMNFDRNGLANEASLSAGDSGGGSFIKTATGWKLAGISFGTDNPWRINAADPSFFANIFDAGGLFPGTAMDAIQDGDADVPASSYVTRISSNLAWINSVLAAGSQVQTPEPAGAAVAAMLLPLILRRRR